MATEVERVLVSLGFVFVLEAVVAELAGVLLFHLVRSGSGGLAGLFRGMVVGRDRKLTVDPLGCRTSWVSLGNIRRDTAHPLLAE